MREAMATSPLVSTAWLEDHLADPDLRIIEVCSRADDKASEAAMEDRKKAGYF